MNHTIIITTVGTSMFSNYLEEPKNSNHKNIWKDIKDKPYTEQEYTRQEAKPPFQDFKKAIQEGLDSKLFSCAELDTIREIKNKYGNNVEHHLLCSETIAGYLAGQILGEKLSVKFENNQTIEKLQTYIAEGFKETVFLDLIKKVQSITKYHNLVKKSIEVLDTKDGDTINKFKKNIQDELDENREPFNTLFTKPKGSWKDFVNEKVNSLIASLKSNKVFINYSGGYKALIPYLTILGQLYDYDLAYVHEKSEELIDTKPLPINFDVSLSERYYPYLTKFGLNSEKDEEDNQSSISISKQNLEEKYPVIIQELVDNQLIYKDNKDEYHSTAFGEIIWKYIDLNHAIGKNPMSFYIELKLYKFYRTKYVEIDKPVYSQVIHNEELVEKWIDNETNKKESYKHEIDLKLIKADKNFILVEVKGFGQMFKTHELLDRASKRIKVYQKEEFGGKKPQEYHLVFYKASSDENDFLKESIEVLTKEITKLGVVFKAFYINIELEKQGNPYFGFMQKDLIKITPFGE